MVSKKTQVLQSLWTTRDILLTNLVDILEYANVNTTNNDELDLNGNTGWDSDNYDKEIDRLNTLLVQNCG